LVNSLVSKSRFFSRQNSKLDFSSQGSEECRTFAGRNAWLANMVALGARGGVQGNQLRHLTITVWLLFRDGLGIDIYMYLFIHDIAYMHDIYVRVYIHMYIHTYIYTYIFIEYKYSHIITWSRSKYVRLYTLMLTITIKNCEAQKKLPADAGKFFSYEDSRFPSRSHNCV